MHAISPVKCRTINRTTEPVVHHIGRELVRRFCRKIARKSIPKRYDFKLKSLRNRLPGRPGSPQGPEER